MTQINNSGELQTFFYQENNVRTVIIRGEAWWVLKDVCDVLEIYNSRDVTSRLDDDEKATIDIIDVSSNGKKQSRFAAVVNESGLYNVIFLSRKLKTKQFKRWITQEILPSIRKHGAYFTTSKLEELMTDPDAWIKSKKQQLHALTEKLQFPRQVRLQAEGSCILCSIFSQIRGNKTSAMFWRCKMKINVYMPYFQSFSANAASFFKIPPIYIEKRGTKAIFPSYFSTFAVPKSVPPCVSNVSEIKWR